MADLGLGTSDYPGTLDTNPTPEVGTNSTKHLPGEGAITAAIAIQTELGVNPAGSKADVVTYLQTEHDTDAKHTFKYPFVFTRFRPSVSISAEVMGIAGMYGRLLGSTTWDPGSLADGAGETKQLTVTGAALGDFVLVSAPYDLQDMLVSGYVQAADTVEIRLQNESGGVVDLASGTWQVMVISTNPAAASYMAQVNLPWGGSIVGISVASSAARTAGTLTAEVAIDSVGVGLTAALDGTNTQYDETTQAIGTDLFVAGQNLSVELTTDGSWDNSNGDITVIVYISFN